MSRRVLADRQSLPGRAPAEQMSREGAIIEPVVPDKDGDRGRPGADNRLFLVAILLLARGASPWRDLGPLRSPQHAQWRLCACAIPRRGPLNDSPAAFTKPPQTRPSFVMIDQQSAAPFRDCSGVKNELPQISLKCKRSPVSPHSRHN